MTDRLTLRTRDEWLAARRIGSSDVAAILGLSSYRTGWDVYARLVEGWRDDSTSAAAERGVVLEPTVLREYARATGNAIRRPPPHTLYARDEWATASPDALGDGLIVEAKTDRHRERWGEPCTIKRWEPEHASVVRRDYYLQVCHQLYVLDVERADLAVLVPGDDPFVPELRVYTVLRDRELEGALVERLRGWWQRHVVERVPPEVDGSDAAGRYLSARERRGARKATVGEVALAAQYHTARELAGQWETERRRLAQQLVAAAGDVARLDLPVGRVTLVRNAGRTTLDERALLAEHPELGPVLDQYRRTSSPYTYPTISGLESTS